MAALTACAFIASRPCEGAATLQLQTLGSSFTAGFAFDNGAPPTYLWNWSDGTTSTVYPTVTKDFGTAGVRTQSLTVTPGAPTKINLGFDGSDGGWTNQIFSRPGQNVGLVTFATPLPNLLYWASSYNPISNTLNFTGFTNLQDIECFHCSNLQHVVVANLPSLQRVCFEHCNLQDLDLTGNTNLADVRGALNSYTSVTIGGGAGPKIWHWCFRDNPQIVQDFSLIMTNFYSLKEAWFWNANQGGALHFVSSNLTDVEVFENHYTSADFTGQTNIFELLISENNLTNLVLTGCKALVQFDAHQNQLPSVVLDAILAELDLHSPAIQYINLSQNAQFPSDVGFAHCANLTARGVEVHVDTPVQPVKWPVVTLNSAALISEGCLPTNNAIDPGEAVTMRFSLSNVGAGNASNVTVRLLAGNGVVSPSGAQQFASLATNGPAITSSFTFVANGACGGPIAPVLQIEENVGILTQILVPLQLGRPVVLFSENFDGVVAPAIPATWTRTNTGAQTAWVTDSSFSDTAPNSVLIGDATAVGSSILTSPAINVSSNISLLTFRNAYDLECDPAVPTNGFDGGVLEIQVGTNAFTDFLAAGGGFVSGGYTRTISTNFQSSLAGRQAWSGHAGGFVMTMAVLPASALGKTIHLRWRSGTDMGTSGGTWSGWRIDSVSVTAGSCSTNQSPPVIQSMLASNSIATISWNSVAGRNYRVQYKGSISSVSWTNLVPDITATNYTASTTDAVTGVVQRFYRVVLLP